MMSYIVVERDVKLEVADESYEAGYSVAGLGRCAVRMPVFTEAGLKVGLGKTHDLIERATTNLALAAIDAKQLDT